MPGWPNSYSSLFVVEEETFFFFFFTVVFVLQVLFYLFIYSFFTTAQIHMDSWKTQCSSCQAHCLPLAFAHFALQVNLEHSSLHALLLLKICNIQPINLRCWGRCCKIRGADSLGESLMQNKDTHFPLKVKPLLWWRLNKVFRAKMY